MTVSAKETIARAVDAGQFLGLAVQIINAAGGETKRADEAAHVIAVAFSAIIDERDALREALEAAEDMDQRGIFKMGISEIDRVHELRRTALSQFRQETK